MRFQDEKALEEWRIQPEHRATQARGQTEFYEPHWVPACKVFREYEFQLERGTDP